MEKLWKLSKAQGGQKWGGAALGIANLVGVLVLQGLLASRGVQATQYAELATALSGPLFLLKVHPFSTLDPELCCEWYGPAGRCSE